MARVRLFGLLFLFVAGCGSTDLHRDPPTLKEPAGRKVIAWRLVDRSYGTIEDRWAASGDGALPPGELALLHEPVYEERLLAGGVVIARTSCAHRIRIDYGGPTTLEVGRRVKVGLAIDGPEGLAHEIAVAGSHPGIAVTGVSGAEPVAGKPGRYRLAARAEARVLFSSTTVGRGGIVISIVREIGDE